MKPKLNNNNAELHGLGWTILTYLTIARDAWVAARQLITIAAQPAATTTCLLAETTEIRALTKEFRVELIKLLFCCTNSSGVHPASCPTLNGDSFLGVKRSGREADHSPASSSIEVNNAHSYTSSSPICLHGVMLNKAQGQLRLPLYPFTIFIVLLTKQENAFSVRFSTFCVGVQIFECRSYLYWGIQIVRVSQINKPHTRN